MKVQIVQPLGLTRALPKYWKHLVPSVLAPPIFFVGYFVTLEHQRLMPFLLLLGLGLTLGSTTYALVPVRRGEGRWSFYALSCILWTFGGFLVWAF